MANFNLRLIFHARCTRVHVSCVLASRLGRGCDPYQVQPISGQQHHRDTYAFLLRHASDFLMDPCTSCEWLRPSKSCRWFPDSKRRMIGERPRLARLRFRQNATREHLYARFLGRFVWARSGLPSENSRGPTGRFKPRNLSHFVCHAANTQA
jgi:hypothetical protein